jgi:hypothetical protein
MTFGYKSISSQGSVLSLSSLRRTALQLLQALKSLRKRVETPIVFLAHGLGGVIVKQVSIERFVPRTEADPAIY